MNANSLFNAIVRESADSLETFRQEDTIQSLTEALKYARNRLNGIPHRYEDTDFKMIREAIKQGEQCLQQP